MPPCSVGCITERLLLRLPPPPLNGAHGPQLPTMQSTGQACVSQSASSLRMGQLPPCRASCVLSRKRLCRPPPQVLVQVLHELQSPTVQCTGQWRTKQGCFCRRSGQARPPHFALRTGARLRHCTPLPHVLLHACHLPHAAMRQFIGHSDVLHICACRTFGHFLPPPDAQVKIVRPRKREPLPQEREQVLHSPHDPTLQSTLHTLGAHESDSSVTGHTMPPLLACATIERVRHLMPPPQVTTTPCRVHLPHAPHWLTAQCTGHGPASQRCVYVSCGHATPPRAASRYTKRLRVAEPCVPHVSEHAPQAPHWPTMQSTGHSILPHARTSRLAPHGFPCTSADCSTVRLRI